MSKFFYEKELLDRLKQGDEMAFELIFHRSKGKLMGFLKKSLPADEDEESVMQDIYLKLWVGRKTIHSDKDFETDRKSTRLNSSHVRISYAVICLKKKTTGRHRAARH